VEPIDEHLDAAMHGRASPSRALETATVMALLAHHEATDAGPELTAVMQTGQAYIDDWGAEVTLAIHRTATRALDDGHALARHAADAGRGLQWRLEHRLGPRDWLELLTAIDEGVPHRRVQHQLRSAFMDVRGLEGAVWTLTDETNPSPASLLELALQDEALDDAGLADLVRRLLDVDQLRSADPDQVHAIVRAAIERLGSEADTERLWDAYLDWRGRRNETPVEAQAWTEAGRRLLSGKRLGRALDPLLARPIPQEEASAAIEAADPLLAAAIATVGAHHPQGDVEQATRTALDHLAEATGNDEPGEDRIRLLVTRLATNPRFDRAGQAVLADACRRAVHERGGRAAPHVGLLEAIPESARSETGAAWACLARARLALARSELAPARSRLAQAPDPDQLATDEIALAAHLAKARWEARGPEADPEPVLSTLAAVGEHVLDTADPSLVVAYCQSWAQAHAAVGQPERAGEVLDRAAPALILTGDPARAVSHTAFRARLLLDRDRVAAARETLDSATDQLEAAQQAGAAESLARFERCRSRVARRRDQQRQALGHVSRAVEWAQHDAVSDRLHASTLHERAAILNQLRRPDQALEALERADSLATPRRLGCDLALERARALESRGRPREALDPLPDPSEISDQRADARRFRFNVAYEQALLSLRTRECEAALDAARRLVDDATAAEHPQAGPMRTKARLLEVRILSQLHRVDAARRALEAAREHAEALDPENLASVLVEVELEDADVRRLEGDTDAALACLEQAGEYAARTDEPSAAIQVATSTAALLEREDEVDAALQVLDATRDQAEQLAQSGAFLEGPASHAVLTARLRLHQSFEAEEVSSVDVEAAISRARRAAELSPPLGIPELALAATAKPEAQARVLLQDAARRLDNLAEDEALASPTTVATASRRVALGLASVDGASDEAWRIARRGVEAFLETSQQFPTDTREAVTDRYNHDLVDAVAALVPHVDAEDRRRGMGLLLAGVNRSLVERGQAVDPAAIAGRAPGAARRTRDRLTSLFASATGGVAHLVVYPHPMGVTTYLATSDDVRLFALDPDRGRRLARALGTATATMQQGALRYATGPGDQLGIERAQDPVGLQGGAVDDLNVLWEARSPDEQRLGTALADALGTEGTLLVTGSHRAANAPLHLLPAPGGSAATTLVGRHRVAYTATPHLAPTSLDAPFDRAHAWGMNPILADRSIGSPRLFPEIEDRGDASWSTVRTFDTAGAANRATDSLPDRGTLVLCAHGQTAGGRLKLTMADGQTLARPALARRIAAVNRQARTAEHQGLNEVILLVCEGARTPATPNMKGLVRDLALAGVEFVHATPHPFSVDQARTYATQVLDRRADGQHPVAAHAGAVRRIHGLGETPRSLSLADAGQIPQLWAHDATVASRGSFGDEGPLPRG
jgi:tetratricopeptide (TPR) repeat protein